ncbi:MAG: phage tail tape measure protein, partial [Bacillales bacterium]
MANVGEIRASLTLESRQFQLALANARRELQLTATSAQTANQALESIGRGSIVNSRQITGLNRLQRQLGQTTTDAAAARLALTNIRNTQIIGPTVNQNITNVNNGLNGVSSSANRARESMKKLHGVALGMSAAVGVAFAASINTAANFEQKMKDVEAVSGATGSEMTQLADLAKDMGAKTAFSASEAASGIEELIKAGLTVTQIMD